jgi:hypothetical protein
MEANYSKDTKDLILQSTRTSYSSILALGKTIRKGPFLKDISLLLRYSLLKYYLDPSYLGYSLFLQKILAKTLFLYIFEYIHIRYSKEIVMWNSFKSTYKRGNSGNNL